jgi:hypothetical protein
LSLYGGSGKAARPATVAALLAAAVLASACAGAPPMAPGTARKPIGEF